MPILGLSIVIPTFNEAGNIALLLRRLETVLGPAGWEVIFVDDDSPDGTASAVREIARTDPRVRCLQRVGRRGLSAACIEGMMAASAPLIAVMDADLQHDEAILPACRPSWMPAPTSSSARVTLQEAARGSGMRRART